MAGLTWGDSPEKRHGVSRRLPGFCGQRVGRLRAAAGCGCRDNQRASEGCLPCHLRCAAGANRWRIAGEQAWSQICASWRELLRVRNDGQALTGPSGAGGAHAEGPPSYDRGPSTCATSGPELPTASLGTRSGGRSCPQPRRIGRPWGTRRAAPTCPCPSARPASPCSLRPCGPCGSPGAPCAPSIPPKTPRAASAPPG